MKKNAFLDFLSNKFDEIKNTFKHRMVNMGLAFDEDVYSDTIIQCNEKLGNDILEMDMIKYFWMSFKNNTIREFKYDRNKKRSDIEEMKDIIIEDSYDLEEEFNEVSLMIINEFGEELYQLFTLHANGKPYRELKKMTRIPNLKYKFRRIREYVRENFKKGKY